jgi:hypothetical protein
VAKKLSPPDRLLATARDRFYQDGIHSVGVDRLVKVARGLRLAA